MYQIIGMIDVACDSQSETDRCFRRPNIYFNITSPTPGTFIIALHYKGREKAILEMDLNIDDLLEKVSMIDLPRTPNLHDFYTNSKRTTSISSISNTYSSMFPKCSDS